MKSFIIESEESWYTDPATEKRLKGEFLYKPITAYFHDDYHGGDVERRNTRGTVENIICTLKNQFKEKNEFLLLRAVDHLTDILKTDLPQVLNLSGKEKLTVCVVPRAKTESFYSENQKLFRKAVSDVVDGLDRFENGTQFIIRDKDTRTTHMDRSGRGGAGDLPYPGITRETCTISTEVKDKDILLVDDLYTATVNIDEDAIQALLDKGARSVVFYSPGKTLSK